MRRVIVLVVGLLASCGSPAASVVADNSPVASPSLTYPSPLPAPSTGLPVKLQIPALKINSPIMQVGLVNGAVGTPCDPTKKTAPCNTNASAWYNGSVRPGEPGDAVIDGHVDWYGPAGSNHDIPAVFAHLNQLKVGDAITITADDGIARTFLVSALITLPYPQQPLQTYVTSGPAMVTLITCAGVYVSVAEGMNRRLYVQATVAA